MATYRFFKTSFFDSDNNCESFDICIHRQGRRGCATTGSIVSFRKANDKIRAGWWCDHTIKEGRLPETTEIAQSTAHKLMRRCPVRFYKAIYDCRRIHPCVPFDAI